STLVGAEKAIARRSLLVQLGLVAVAVLLLIIPVWLGYTGNPERHDAVLASIPIAVVLLGLYLTVTGRNLRRHRDAERGDGHDPSAGAWSLPTSLVALALATVATAVVSEILVHSLEAFAEAIGATDFFIAAVIVAIVGNAAEHGGAIVIARAGKMKLASEIAVSSSAQVGLLVAPAVVLLSLFFANRLPLTFRWEEIAAMAGAVLLTIAVVRDGRSKRKDGLLLVVAYLGVARGFLAAG